MGNGSETTLPMMPGAQSSKLSCTFVPPISQPSCQIQPSTLSCTYSSFPPRSRASLALRPFTSLLMSEGFPGERLLTWRPKMQLLHPGRLPLRPAPADNMPRGRRAVGKPIPGLEALGLYAHHIQADGEWDVTCNCCCQGYECCDVLR